MYTVTTTQTKSTIQAIHTILATVTVITNIGYSLD
jgi:hypothetical protein